MILTLLNREVPRELYHDPTIQDRWGFTVAMYQAIKRKKIDDWWVHSPVLTNSDGDTVAMILA